MGRTVIAALIGLLSYPLGFVAGMLAVLTVMSWAFLWPDAPHPSLLGQILSYVLPGLIVLLGSIITTTMLTAGFAVATRYWPRQIFRRLAALICTAVCVATIASVMQLSLAVPRLPLPSVVGSILRDPFRVFFGFAWSVPMVMLVGEPLFAALLGRWFYQAAMQWSTEST